VTQDQVVVVVSDQEQPGLPLNRDSYQMAAVPMVTRRNLSVAKQPQGYHMNLPRLPDPQASQLLTRRRQAPRRSSTSTQVNPDNQLPWKQLPRQQAAISIDNQLLRQQIPISTDNQLLRQQTPVSIDSQLLRQQGALATDSQLPRQQATEEQLPRQPPSSLSGDDTSVVQTRKRTHSNSSSDSVSRHSEQSSPSPGKEGNAFRCGQCGKTFPQRSVLQIHVCPKQPYKPYHCGHCNRLFDDPNELRNHAMMHTNEKPFKCGYCSRSFSGATTLNNHMRTHTGEKPFECQVCGKTFSQASQLSRHEKIPGDCVEK